jgi:lipopolysaccharide/colanic/teichoic acid biosynthesis glycosyltransferase
MHTELLERKTLNYSSLKRVVDILVGLSGLPFVVVAIALIGVAITIDDQGEIFFQQERIGQNGKKFSMYKLRTYGKDGQKTRVGKIIRPFALDEVPQIFNILKGDMSLVGIRALSEVDFFRIIKIYQSDSENFNEQFLTDWINAYYSAKPGGLSLAVAEGDSIFNRGYNDFLAVQQKMSHDIKQANTPTLKKDLKILFTTLTKVLGARRSLPEK